MLALCAAGVVGCGRAPAPPYSLAFTLEGRAPRVLQASDEITVPIAVVNTGQRAWDPGRVHVSYHWLWLVPREIVSRSRWNAPYHDGIRTELSGLVAPGARVAVRGRVLAPPVPGVYWLQWDMVEEGVTWFAQVSPRQPLVLVIVVPPLFWILGPLPLLVAIAGIAALKGQRYARVALSADIWWCLASLFAKPFVIFHDALLEPTAVAYWLTIVTATLPVAVVALAFPRRVRAWVLLAAGIFGSLVILADVFYYRFFGDVLSAPALLGVRQTGHVWGSIRSLFTPGLVWLVGDWPFAVWLTIRLSRRQEPSPSLGARARVAAAALAILAVSGVALSARRVLASAPLDQMFRDRAVVEQLGPFGFHAYDTWNYLRGTWLRVPVSDAQMADAVAWFEARAPVRAGAGPSFGAARGKNVIVVQVESLQDFVVNLRVGGQDVMPHLRQWTDDSVRFTNVTDQTNEGRTSDAELTTLASLLPLEHGAAAFRYPGNHYVALPRVLADRGYRTLSAVAFEPGFWNRQVMHPSYGFQHTLFEADFQMTEQIGWGLNDRDFLQQMVPHLTKMPRPFLAWVITLSLHHPFEDFPPAHKVLKLGALEGTSFGNYLHTMRFFDQALEEFKDALAGRGLLDESMVVVFGDHDAGFARDASLAGLIGIRADDAAWALNDRVPVFVRAPGLRGVRATPAGQTDVAPTLLALLGIDPAPLPYVGRNLLGAVDREPWGPGNIVPRPYGDWLGPSHLGLTRGLDHTCVDLARQRTADWADCRSADEAARRERDVSRLVVTDDLQQRIWKRLTAAAR
jgi:phosphoglycerol transferase MdoB-like AlkP superfamily enzyme